MTSLRTPVGPELNLRSQMLFLNPPPASASDLVNAFLVWNRDDVFQFLEPGSEFSSHWLRPLLRVANSEYCWPMDLLDRSDASILFEAIAMSAALDDVLADAGPLSTGHLPLSALHAAPGAADRLSADLQEVVQLQADWPSQ